MILKFMKWYLLKFHGMVVIKPDQPMMKALVDYDAWRKNPYHFVTREERKALEEIK